MNNYIQEGNTLTLVADAAIAAGEAMLKGKIFGVAVKNVAANEKGEFRTAGVFELPALGTDVAAECAIWYWDSGNKRLTITATSNTRVGVAVEAKAAGATTAIIKLDAVIA